MTTQAQLFRFEQDAMATVFEVMLKGTSREDASNAATEAFRLLIDLERLLSRFIDTSEISRINALSKGAWAGIGCDTYDCLIAALYMSEQTKGAFNVTYQTAQSDQQCGRPETQIRLDPAKLKVYASADDPRVDLGAIGKGYAVDRMAALLRDWGYESAVIHGGASTVLAYGDLTTDIDLRHTGVTDCRFTLANGAFSGSAAIDNVEHIVDTGTGAPAKKCLGAWAYAPMATLADALSTAFMVMDDAEIDTLVEEHPEWGAAVLRDHDGLKIKGALRQIIA